MPPTQTPRPWPALLVGLASCAGILSTTIFLVIITNGTFSSQPAVGILCVVAACLQLIALTFLLPLLYHEWQRPERRQRLRSDRIHRPLHLLLSTCAATIAAITTLAAIIYMRIALGSLWTSPLSNGVSPFDVQIGLIVSWAFSILCQVALLALILRHGTSQSPPSSSPDMVARRSRLASDRTPTYKSSARSLTSTEPSLFSSSSFSTFTPSLSSLRSSVVSTVRTASTPTRPGLSRPASRGSHSRPPSSSRDSRPGSRPGSRSNDVPLTSHEALPPSAARDLTLAANRLGVSTLAPIPGSRPVSPAKVLDGPFPDTADHNSTDHSNGMDQINGNSTDHSDGIDHSDGTDQTNGNSVSPVSTRSPRISRTISMPRPASPRAMSPRHSPSLDSLRPLSRSELPFATPPSRQSPRIRSRTGSCESLHLWSPSRPHAQSVASLADSVSHLREGVTPPAAEDHIHPLFRTTSPVPPPAASRGTVVHAASVPEAAELASLSPDLASRPVSRRPRVSSRSATPTPSSPLASTHNSHKHSYGLGHGPSQGSGQSQSQGLGLNLTWSPTSSAPTSPGLLPSRASTRPPTSDGLWMEAESGFREMTSASSEIPDTAGPSANASANSARASDSSEVGQTGSYSLDAALAMSADGLSSTRSAPARTGGGGARPAIPDFVMAAGSRGSFLGFARRRGEAEEGD